MNVDNEKGKWYYVVEWLTMASTCMAITKQDGGGWIEWIEQVPGVNCKERTREELLASLRTILAEVLQLNRREAIQVADDTEKPVTL